MSGGCNLFNRADVLEIGGFDTRYFDHGGEDNDLCQRLRRYGRRVDIHLSDMDGRMVCERVKSRPETKSTRILAISGYIDDDEASMLQEYGFDDYLKKPFRLSELVERVGRLFEIPASKLARPRRTAR